MPRALPALAAVAAAVALLPAVAQAQLVAPTGDAVGGAGATVPSTTPPAPPATSAADPATPGTAGPAAVPGAAAQVLPGGGTTILPGRRVVALYGFPGAPSLGALGQGTSLQAVARLKALATSYARPGTPVLPAFELLAGVAQRSPGSDRTYRKLIDPLLARRWLQTARSAGAYLVLELQGGREDLLTQAKAFAPLLREPDVGLGLDPEWVVGKGGVPGRTRGAVDAAEVNAVSRYLSGIVAQEGGPQKLLVVHRFTRDMLRDDDELEAAPGVATVIDVDAIGDARSKEITYDALSARTPSVAAGLMLFPRRDGKVMSPDQVIALDPSPSLVGVQ